MWKRIMKWVGVILLVPSLGVAGYAGWSAWVESQPRVELALYGITVGDSMDDVMYKKGKPDVSKDCPPGNAGCEGRAVWIYGDTDVRYLVSFKDSKVQRVSAHAREGKRYALPTFRGMSNYWGQAEVERLYGTPTKVSVSANRTQRLASFVNYGVFITFEKDEIVAVGVMAPMGEPVSFTEEAQAQ